MNFYGKFLPNLSSVLAPLHKLLLKGAKWHWGAQQTEAFNKVKFILASTELLVQFDPGKDLLISCDASPCGIGAVLAHKMIDRTERPIMYASRSLATAEGRYSQLDKKSLAIIFAVKKFHQYIYGRKFTIY